MTDTLGMNHRHTEVLLVIRGSEVEGTATLMIGNESFNPTGYILIFGQEAEVYKGPIERRSVNNRVEPRCSSGSQQVIGG